MKSATYFDEYLSTGFARYNDGGEGVIRQNYAHNFLPFMPKNKAARILDIGCGMGQCLEWMQSEGFTQIEGIEVSREGVEYCVKRGLNVSQAKDTEKGLKNNQPTFE